MVWPARVVKFTLFSGERKRGEELEYEEEDAEADLFLVTAEGERSAMGSCPQTITNCTGTPLRATPLLTIVSHAFAILMPWTF